MSEAEAANKVLSARVAKLSAESEAVAKLRDEIDVLRPLAAAKEKAEATAERLKKKVDGIPELRDQIKRLEDSNKALMAKVLELEKEVAKIQPLRISLQEAQEAHCTSDIRCSELEAALAEARASVEEMRSALAAATDAGASSSQWSSVSSELSALQQAEMAVLANTVSASGSGAGGMAGGADGSVGLNEFNPELAEKLARLQQENADLKASLDGGSVEHIVKLERQLQDAVRMKSAFEGKYLQMKSKAADLEKELGGAKAQIAELLANLATKEVELAALRRENSEMDENYKAVERQALILRTQLSAMTTSMDEQKKAWAAEKERLLRDIEREKAALQSANAHHSDSMASAQADRDAMVQELRQELQRRVQQLQNEVSRNNRAAEETLAEKEAEFAATLRNAERRHADAMSRLQDEFDEQRRNADDRQRQMTACAAQREANLVHELESYRDAHSVSDKEYLGRIAQLQDNVNALQSKLASLEAQKEKGIQYVQQLQADIQMQADEYAVQAELAETRAIQLAEAYRRLEIEEDNSRTLRMEYDEVKSMLKKARKEARNRTDDDDELAVVSKALEAEVAALTKDKAALSARSDALVTYLRGMGATIPPCLMQGVLPPGFAEADGSAASTASAEAAPAATSKVRARRVKATTVLDPEAAARSVAEQLVFLEKQMVVLQEERNKALISHSEALRLRNDAEAERDSLADKNDVLEAECTRAKLAVQRMALQLESLGHSADEEAAYEGAPADMRASGVGGADEDEFCVDGEVFFKARGANAAPGSTAPLQEQCPKQSSASGGAVSKAALFEKAALAAAAVRGHKPASHATDGL